MIKINPQWNYYHGLGTIPRIEDMLSLCQGLTHEDYTRGDSYHYWDATGALVVESLECTERIIEYLRHLLYDGVIDETGKKLNPYAKGETK